MPPPAEKEATLPGELIRYFSQARYIEPFGLVYTGRRKSASTLIFREKFSFVKLTKNIKYLYPLQHNRYRYL